MICGSVTSPRVAAAAMAARALMLSLRRIRRCGARRGAERGCSVRENRQYGGTEVRRGFDFGATGARSQAKRGQIGCDSGCVTPNRPRQGGSEAWQWAGVRHDTFVSRWCGRGVAKAGGGQRVDRALTGSPQSTVHPFASQPQK